MVAKLNEDPNTAAATVLSLRSMFFYFDTLTTEVLKDKRVRLALNYAVDKQAIIDGLLNGLGEASGLGVPIHMAEVDKSIGPYPYDPEKARPSWPRPVTPTVSRSTCTPPRVAIRWTRRSSWPWPIS